MYLPDIPSTMEKYQTPPAGGVPMVEKVNPTASGVRIFLKKNGGSPASVAAREGKESIFLFSCAFLYLIRWRGLDLDRISNSNL